MLQQLPSLPEPKSMYHHLTNWNFYLPISFVTVLCMLSHPVLSDSLQPHELYSPWNSPSQNTGVGSLSLLQGIFPTQGSTRVPHMQVDSLPAKPSGKPKNTGVGSLSLLQRIFPTRESNWGLLHCRQIFYQLSYQGSISIIHHCLLPPHSL